MRSLGVCVGIGALALCAMGACSSSSSSDGQATPDGGAEAGGDDGPAGDGAVDSGPPASDLVPRGGSRIAARYDESADGARVFSDNLDKKLGVVCFPALADDGVMRCMPAVARSASNLFADGGCATRLAQQTKGSCEASSYFVDETTGANKCAIIRTAYTLASTTPATTFFTRDPDGNCVGGTPSPDSDYLPIGAKVASSDFVALTPKKVPAGGGISFQLLAGEDGSLLTYDEQLFDDARGKPCGVVTGDDGKIRCLPSTVYRAYGFSDLGCMSPVANDDDCRVPGVVVDDTVAIGPATSQGACDLVYSERVYQLGAKRATHDFFTGTPASCTGPTTLPYDLFDVGAEMPPATFPLVADVQAGGARIVVDTFQVGGVVVGRRRLHDKAQALTCDPAKAADGVLRCMPNGPATGLMFSDDKCLVPLAVGNEDCEPAKFATTVSGLDCNAKQTINALGTRMDSATASFWSTITGSCMPFVGNTDKYLWTLGAEVPPTTFAELTRVEH